MKDSFWIAANKKHEVPAPPEPEPEPIPKPPAPLPTPEPLPDPVSQATPVVFSSTPPILGGRYQTLAPFEEVESVEEPPFPGALGFEYTEEEQRQMDEAQIVPIKKRRKKKGWKVWWPKSYRMLYKGIRL